MASTDPRTATQEQWEDLADRVQSKAEIGSVLSTPSNVAYVGTNNIVDGAVTEEKLGLSYSTSEQATGKTWIDGKPIYRKVVEKTTVSSGSTNAVNHDISNFGELVLADGYLKAGSNYYLLSRPAAGNLNFYVELIVNSTQVQFKAGNDANFDKGVAIIEYTKSS